MFGMGTGIASPLWPPAFYAMLFSIHPLRDRHVSRPGCTLFVRKSLGREEIFPCRQGNLQDIMNRKDNMVKPHDLLVMLGSMSRGTYTCILST